jgi:SOS-response transcriptional repressor LexA
MSMKNEAERYQFIQNNSGLSKASFAETLGISRSHGNLLETGKQKPPREVMEKLRSIYNVDLNWFVTGIGNPNPNPDPDTEATVEIELLEQEAAAGRGREAEEQIERQAFQIPRSFISPYRPEKLRAVYVAGDSMIDERINDGDIVIFHPGLTEGNGIYVISIGNTLVVKRVDFDILNQNVTLISANPAYPPRRFSGPDIDELRIAGRVLACIHRV